MESELGFNKINDSTIQMSTNWCKKLKLVQEMKMCKERKGQERKQPTKMKMLQYKCYPRCIKREYKQWVLSLTHKT